jgi:hypothetical protein
VVVLNNLGSAKPDRIGLSLGVMPSNFCWAFGESLGILCTRFRVLLEGSIVLEGWRRCELTGEPVLSSSEMSTSSAMA